MINNHQFSILHHHCLSHFPGNRINIRRYYTCEQGTKVALYWSELQSCTVPLTKTKRMQELIKRMVDENKVIIFSSCKFLISSIRFKNHQLHFPGQLTITHTRPFSACTKPFSLIVFEGSVPDCHTAYKVPQDSLLFLQKQHCYLREFWEIYNFWKLYNPENCNIPLYKRRKQNQRNKKRKSNKAGYNI